MSCVKQALAVALCATVALAAVPAAAADRVVLFRSGTDACYQIPGAVRTGSGALIVAAEQRFGYNAAKAAAFSEGQPVPPGTGPVKGCGDSGFINIVVRRSSDGGRNWAPAHVLVTSSRFMAGGYNVAATENPTLIADGRDVALIFTLVRSRGLRNEPACVSLNAKAEDKCGTTAAEYGIWEVDSHDEGAHWAAPRQIGTGVDPRHVDRPGPGHGIVLQSGRWIAPTYDGLLLSDDRGRSWRLGASTHHGQLDGGESSVVALPDGTIWSSARPSSRSARTLPGSPPFRVSAYSRDRGQSYASVTADTRFPMPPISAGLLAWGGHILVSYPRSSAATDGKVDMSARAHLTVSASADGGRTWRSCPINAGSSAYSDLMGVDGANAGVVYEGGLAADAPNPRDYQQAIVFEPLPLASLDRCPPAIPAKR